MPTALRNVRYQGQSGSHMLALSFSGFDPKLTWAAWPLMSAVASKDIGLDRAEVRNWPNLRPLGA
jgi:hypothetical protein